MVHDIDLAGATAGTAPASDPDLRAPRAGGFIVTIYGDVVEPRGGRAWIGNVIETCLRVGISESLVRTAVHRLVAGGRLLGEREGRRSYYSLTKEARREFQAAADVLFRPGERCGLAIAWLPPDSATNAERLAEAGFSRIGGGFLLGPADGAAGIDDVLVFGPADGDPALLRSLAAAHWDFSVHAAAYEAFIARFAPLEATASTEGPADALTQRLLLVHEFRRVALRDPRLPAAALPADWVGARARVLFARLYLALSDAADAHVAATFDDGNAALPRSTEATRQRLASLKAIAGG